MPASQYMSSWPEMTATRLQADVPRASQSVLDLIVRPYRSLLKVFETISRIAPQSASRTGIKVLTAQRVDHHSTIHPLLRITRQTSK